MFTIDTNDTFGGDKIPAGNYEVLIEKFDVEQTKTGRDILNIRLRIRNDIKQPYQNAIIFVAQFPSKETNQFNMKFFNTVAKAAGIQGGSYNTLADLCRVYVGKPVEVKMEYEKYNDNENSRIKQWNPTKFPTVNHKQEQKNEMQGLGVEVAIPNDLPF